MQNTLSASQLRFLEATQSLREISDRTELYDRLASLLQQTRLRIFAGEFGRRIFAKDESENIFSESHYDRCWIPLLRSLEDKGNIVPGKTTLLEVTSGSAGRSLGNIARILNYRTTIVVPTLDGSRHVGVAEAADDLIDSSYPDDKLAGAVRTFREMIGDVVDGKLRLRPETKKRLRENMLCLPNHSQAKITPEAFAAIGREAAVQLPSDARIGAFVGGIGNGSTIKGILAGLRHQGMDDVRFFGYTGPRELFGSGGVEGVQFPFIDELRHGRDIRDDNTFRVSADDWRETYESLNRGQSRKETIGRTSAMSVTLARKLQMETCGDIGDILTVIYDKADQYGSTVVTDPRAIYRGNGEWEQHE